MRNQIVFTTVKNHLLIQEARSEDDKGVCLYRGPNGAKCAIGCLIPNEEFQWKFNSVGVTTLKSIYHLNCLQDLELDF